MNDVVAAMMAQLSARFEGRVVLTIEDVADAIETSPRTIKRRLRAGAFPIPELPGIDRKHRWAVSAVAEWIVTKGSKRR